MDAEERVERHPLLQSLSVRRRESLLGAASLERYGRGTFCFHQGRSAEAVWMVLEGWIHLVRGPDTRHDRGVVLYTVTPADVLCGLSAVERGRYTASALAATHVVAVRFPAAPFQEALQREPAFAYAVLRLCARRLRRMAQRFGTLAEPVPQRLIRSVLQLREQFGAEVPVTHRELAQMSWTTTESAIRIIRRLKARGMLAGCRGRLTIEHPERLTALLSYDGHHRTDRTNGVG